MLAKIENLEVVGAWVFSVLKTNSPLFRMNPIFKGWDPSPERKLLPLWSFNLHFPNFKTTRVFPQRICWGSNVFNFRTLSTWIFHSWSSWSSCTVSELRRDVEPFSSHCFDASSTETRMKMFLRDEVKWVSQLQVIAWVNLSGLLMTTFDNFDQADKLNVCNWIVLFQSHLNSQMQNDCKQGLQWWKTSSGLPFPTFFHILATHAVIAHERNSGAASTDSLQALLFLSSQWCVPVTPKNMFTS